VCFVSSALMSAGQADCLSQNKNTAKSRPGAGFDLLGAASLGEPGRRLIRRRTSPVLTTTKHFPNGESIRKRPRLLPDERMLGPCAGANTQHGPHICTSMATRLAEGTCVGSPLDGQTFFLLGVAFRPDDPVSKSSDALTPSSSTEGCGAESDRPFSRGSKYYQTRPGWRAFITWTGRSP